MIPFKITRIGAGRLDQNAGCKIPDRRCPKIALGIAAIAGLVEHNPARAATDVWSGASSVNWSDPGNWSPQAPQPDDFLSFGGNAGLTNTNDTAAGTQYNGITFGSTAGAFNISGNAIALGGDVVSNAAVASTVNLPVQLNTAINANMTTAASAVTFTNSITGNGSLNKIGPGTLSLLGTADSYSGGTTISGGSLVVKGNNTTPINDGLGTGPITISNGADLHYTSTALFNDIPVTVGTGGATIDFTQSAQFNSSSTLSCPGNDSLTLNLGHFYIAFINSGFSNFNGKMVLVGNGATLDIEANYDYSSFADGSLDLGAGGVISRASVAGQGTETLQIGTLAGGTNSIIYGNGENDGGDVYTIQEGARNENSTFAGQLTQYANSVQVDLTKVGTGTLTLSNNNSYQGDTDVNAGGLTIAKGGSIGSINVNVATGATLTVAGAGGLSTQANLTCNGTALFAGTPTTAGPTSLTLASISIASNGSSGAVAIADAGATNHSNRSLLVTGTLTFGGSTDAWMGSLDLASNDLAVLNGSLADITNQVKAGYNGGNWNGTTGITSSTAAENSSHLTALGVIQNSTDGTPSGPALYAPGAFDKNQAITDATVLVKYTYYGDANLDGIVDGSDYTRIDNGFNNQLTGWFNGDFNYDGKVDGSDYTLIDNAFNQQSVSLAAQVASNVDVSAQLASSAAVPEPATGAVGLFAGLALARRKRMSV